MNTYTIVKAILSILALLAFSVEVFFLFKWIIMTVKGSKERGKKTRSAVIAMISFFIFGISLVAFYAVSVKQYSDLFDYSALPQFTVTSDSIQDGRWNKNIGSKHGNVSPALKWDAVEGATTYAVVMIDPDGNNWLHLAVYSDSAGVSEGEFSDSEGQYIGPYPPSGDHKYIVYVFALKSEAYSVGATLNQAGADIDEIAENLNSGQVSDFGNIISYGQVEALYGAD